MNEKIDISVIVPIYNGEAFVERCCKLLAMQTLKSIEVILVDDGSEDNSLDVCKRICDVFDNFKWLHQENQGVSVARNTGIAQARGEYISFVDVDDTWSEDMFETFYYLAVQHHLDLLIRGNGQLGVFHICPNEREAISDFLFGKIGNSSCGGLFHRSLLPDFHFPEGVKVNEDAYANYLAIKKAKCIGRINTDKYHYEQRESSSSRAPRFTAKYMDMININTTICSEVQKLHPELRTACRRRTAIIYLRLSCIYYKRQHPKEFRGEIEKIKQWLWGLTATEQAIFYKRTQRIRHTLYLHCFPLFYLLIKTIDRK